MPMTPIDRKVELLRKGVSMSEIANSLGMSVQHVSAVIAGNRRSPRVEAEVASRINRTAEEVFGPQPEAAANA